MQAGVRAKVTGAGKGTGEECTEAKEAECESHFAEPCGRSVESRMWILDDWAVSCKKLDEKLQDAKVV